MLVEGLYSLIVGDPVVSAILNARPFPRGAVKTSGLFPMQMPEGDPLPAIVYQEIFGEGTMTQDGPDPLQYSRMQFDVYGENYKSCKALARALRQLLEGTTGALADGTLLFSAERVSEIDTFEESPFVFRTTLDMRIAYDDLSGVGQPIQNFQPPAAPQFAFADNETPAGAIDGVNAAFTLAHAPNPAGSLELELNGLTQTQGDDYTLAGAAITFATPPEAGAKMRAWYRY